MDNDFQDRIDRYLLDGGKMTDEEKAQFLKEISEDAEKREQYEFTMTVKSAITSREEKLKAMKKFQRQTASKRRNKVWLWASSIAAVAIIGIMVIAPRVWVGSAPADGPVRGGDDVFDAVPDNDSTKNDSIMNLDTVNDNDRNE